MSFVQPRLTAIATAVPDHDIHQAFIGWADNQLTDPRERRLFARMADRSGIEHRWSVLPPTADGGSPVAPGGFYAGLSLPSTGKRMALYARHAADLALTAIAGLGPDKTKGVTHLIVASCTGFVAPGIDQIIARRLTLSPAIERLLIGFMGCYAAVTALRTARHIVRSDPQAKVLVVTVELSTLHLQMEKAIEPLLAMLHFGDGASAALVSAEGAGLALGEGVATTLPESAEMIRWDIGDTGFAMHLSGAVPGRIEAALRDPAMRAALKADRAIDAWAVHAGGRTILDAVEAGLGLDPDALKESRATLRDNGNMSSSTLMFTLESLMAKRPGAGAALAFGPGLAAEGFGFGWTD